MNVSAIILCGGGSRRMGCDKAMLDFGGQPMLAHVVERISSDVPIDQMVCVAAAEQPLPSLPTGVRVIRDRTPDCGPLEGLAAGLSALADSRAVFVTTCDAPLVVPKLPRFLLHLLGDYDAVMPRIDGQLYPLTAIYRPAIGAIADRRLADGQRRVIDFVAELNVRYVDEELKQVDPQLLSIRNCNTMEEYAEMVEIDAKAQRDEDARSP